MLETISIFLRQGVALAWGAPLLVLVLGGGLYLMVLSRGLPLLHMTEAWRLLLRTSDKSGTGQLSHFQALSTALASTIGLGNIAGVAIAITQGGPGAIFWMWISATLGMIIKFFSCSLAVMYRTKDKHGEVLGGPMYTIEIGLGHSYRWLAIFFSAFGLMGLLGSFNANQMATVLYETTSVPKWSTGICFVLITASVIIGGIKRIGRVASVLVPAMCLLYLGLALAVLCLHIEKVPSIFAMIFHDAFCGSSAIGGFSGAGVAFVIQTGVKRAAFSNEAGIGTAPMAHAQAKTNDPISEGLVAMIGPSLDTLFVCTLTAFVILSSGIWTEGQGVEGITLTLRAVENSLGLFGVIVLLMVASLFSITTMIGTSYYGKKCSVYLFGEASTPYYYAFYLGMLMVGALWTVDSIVNLNDIAYALMVYPNMTATLILAPRVMKIFREHRAKNLRTRSHRDTL
ncbi:MAG: alanine:cation symporter family protein [Myxococcales bacterium]|nr:MAG: alanine:cation symporter family protein [Myxococcales bacterium]